MPRKAARLFRPPGCSVAFFRCSSVSAVSIGVLAASTSWLNSGRSSGLSIVRSDRPSSIRHHRSVAAARLGRPERVSLRVGLIAPRPSRAWELDKEEERATSVCAAEFGDRWRRPHTSLRSPGAADRSSIRPQPDFVKSFSPGCPDPQCTKLDRLSGRCRHRGRPFSGAIEPDKKLDRESLSILRLCQWSATTRERACAHASNSFAREAATFSDFRGHWRMRTSSSIQCRPRDVGGSDRWRN